MLNFLIYTDGKAGHENQSKALAEGLGGSYTLVPFTYPNAWRKAMAYVTDWLNLPFCPPIPQGDFSAVLCTGSNTFLPAKRAASKLHIPVVANLFPRGYRYNFDCIIAPSFDRPPNLPNIITSPVNLTPLRPDYYREQTDAFLKRHQPKAKAAALIVGGPNSVAELTTEWMGAQLKGFFAATEGMERWVTTSRRTPKAVEELIDQQLFDYKLIYSRDHFNPIPAFVTLAETLYVTAESTGMLSESVTCGQAGVEILNNLKPQAGKFGRFVDDLCAGGYARRFQVGQAGVAPSRKVDLSGLYQAVRERLKLA